MADLTLGFCTPALTKRERGSPWLVGGARASVGSMLPPESPDPQAAYAVARARVEIRLQELRVALDAHEANRANWKRVGDLGAVEEQLGESAALLRESGSDEN